MDSFCQAPRVFQLEGNLFFERFPDDFRIRSLQADRVGEVILYRLQLDGVGSFQLGNDFLRLIHTKEFELTWVFAP